MLFFGVVGLVDTPIEVWNIETVSLQLANFRKPRLPLTCTAISTFRANPSLDFRARHRPFWLCDWFENQDIASKAEKTTSVASTGGPNF